MLSCCESMLKTSAIERLSPKCWWHRWSLFTWNWNVHKSTNLLKTTVKRNRGASHSASQWASFIIFYPFVKKYHFATTNKVHSRHQKDTYIIYETQGRLELLTYHTGSHKKIQYHIQYQLLHQHLCDWDSPWHPSHSKMMFHMPPSGPRHSLHRVATSTFPSLRQRPTLHASPWHGKHQGWHCHGTWLARSEGLESWDSDTY